MNPEVEALYAVDGIRYVEPLTRFVATESADPATAATDSQDEGREADGERAGQDAPED